MKNLLIWGIVNLGAAVWEIYAYSNRNQLKIEKTSLWEKISRSQININNFWIEGWSEYCKVDSRYIYHQYVWFFELLNAFLAFVFIYALITNNYLLIKAILGISVINCIGYFVTLFLETITCRNIANLKYTKWWMFPVYYLISGIWLIIPWMLYIQLQ